MKAEIIMRAAALAGKTILEAGGETYRVEDTINRILSAYGVTETNSFVIPTGIVISGESREKGITSVVRRVSAIQVDLEKISLVNDLSRRIEKDSLSPEEFIQELEHIIHRPTYPLWILILFSGITAFSFTVIFRGSFHEAACAFMAGILVYVIKLITRGVGLNAFLQNTLGGMTAVIAAQGFLALGIIQVTSTMIIGTIMLLVPGITITNAIRDTFQGDYISGITRGIEAFVTAAGIAMGSGFAVYLLGVI